MRHRPPRLAGPAAVLVAMVLAAPVFAQQAPAPTITVTGAGEAAAAPDAARLRLAVVAAEASASEAMAQVWAGAERLLAAMLRHGVERRDMQTGGVSLTPEFRRRTKDDGAPPAVAGYRARIANRVVVRDLGRLGALLDAALGAGANDIGAVHFFVTERQGLEDEARRGATVGGVRSIEEIGAAPVRPGAGVMMAARAGRAPVAPGEITVRARIRVVYGLNPGQ